MEIKHHATEQPVKKEVKIEIKKFLDTNKMPHDKTEASKNWKSLKQISFLKTKNQEIHTSQ